MTDDEKESMEHFGITLEQRTVYFYKDYKYGSLKEALDYAKIDAERMHESAAPKA